MRRLWLQVAHTSAATLVSVAGSIITLAITAHILGPNGRGVLAAATAWVGLFATLAALSLGQVITHQVAGRAAREWLDDIAGSVALLTVVMTLFGWITAAALYQYTEGRLFGGLSPSVLAVAFLAFPFLLWTDIARYILNALNALSITNWSQIAGACVGAGAVTVLVGFLRLSVMGAVAATVLAAAVAGVTTFSFIVRRSGKLSPRADVLRRLIRGSAALHLNTTGTYLFAQGSVLVLTYYRPRDETGYYQLAMQLFGLVLIVSTSAGTVSYGLVARKGPNAAWPEQRRLLVQSTLFACVLAVVAYVLAPFAIATVAGPRFLPSVALFRLTLPAVIGATFATVMGSQWIGRGLFLRATALTVFIGCGSIACDLILIPQRGMYGAIVSTWVTYGIAILSNGIMALWVQREWRRSINASDHAATNRPPVL